jgi:two-component system, OmpR family, sensor kinase
MMTETKEIRGFALLCDSNGIIKTVLRDDFGLGNNESEGKLFVNLIDPDMRKQSLDFLLEIKQKKISFDFRLNINVKQLPFDFYFIGILLVDDLLIIGADNHKDAIDFVNHLQQINNEQSNQIRKLLKQDVQSVKKDSDDSAYLFDEITDLNNTLVNLQRELTRKNIELARLNELKNKFLGMAAHDLRNPIGVIMGFSDYLMEDMESVMSEDQVQMLKTIQSSSEFMLHLLEDLLDIAAIESGKLMLVLQKTDLTTLVRKNANLNAIIAAKKNINIQVEAHGPIPEVKIDVNKIEQVMNNLISNAIKYSMPGTLIKVNISCGNDLITVAVTDQGQGIPTDEMEKMFNPFQQTSVKATAGEKSTGLGLSIVRNIVLGHGGNIWVESMMGEGSTFFFTLPFKK